MRIDPPPLRDSPARIPGSTATRYALAQTIGDVGPHRFQVALRGIACAGDGTLYAAGDQRIVCYSEDGSFRGSWAIGGTAGAVNLHSDGRVFVGRRGSIAIFNSRGQPLDVWSDDQRLGLPTTIGFFDEQVLVGDVAGRCIRRFDPTGRFLNDIGTRPPAIGFRVCNGHLDFAIDAAGVVHVADPGRHRVARYSLQGEFLGSFGRFDGVEPAGFPGCCNPTNLALTPDGWIVVTEKAGPRVKLYDGGGLLRAIIATEEFDPGCKNMDIAVDARGRIFVVDTVEYVIHRFEPVVATEEVGT